MRIDLFIGLIANAIVGGLIVGIITLFKPLKSQVDSGLKKKYYAYAAVQLIFLIIFSFNKYFPDEAILNLFYVLSVFVSFFVGIWLLIKMPQTTWRERLLLSLTFGVPVVLAVLGMADGGF